LAPDIIDQGEDNFWQALKLNHFSSASLALSSGSSVVIDLTQDKRSGVIIPRGVKIMIKIFSDFSQVLGEKWRFS
jgi:hypothetical protein